MNSLPLNKKVKLTGVIGPQNTAEWDRVSLFTDDETEYPVIPDLKGQRLSKLIGQRVAVDGRLIWDETQRLMTLKVDHFEPIDLEEADFTALEPSFTTWGLFPGYA